jgi:hypothetical protein
LQNGFTTCDGRTYFAAILLEHRQVLALGLALDDCHQDGAAHRAFAGEAHSRDLTAWKAAGLPVEPGGRKK